MAKELVYGYISMLSSLSGVCQNLGQGSMLLHRGSSVAPLNTSCMMREAEDKGIREKRL